MLAAVLFSLTVSAQSVLIEPGKQGINANEVQNRTLKVQGNGLLVQSSFYEVPLSGSPVSSNLINNSLINISQQSTGIILDPNGNSNYLANTTYNARARITHSSTPPSGAEVRGMKFRFISLDMDMTGDTLFFSRDAARTQIIAKYTGSQIPQDLLVYGSDIDIYLHFTANGDSETGTGFELSFQLLYDTESISNISQVLGGPTLLFESGRGTFRAGDFPSEELLNRGVNSVAFGKSKASGESSLAAMNGIASNRFSIALGKDAVSSDVGSIAFGQGAVASGEGAVAFGGGGLTTAVFGGSTNEASGDYSFVFNGGNDLHNTASGNSSTAGGMNSTSSGDASFSIGRTTTASANYAVSMGQNTLASGVNSMAMGFNATANSYAMTALGRYNVLSSTPSSWSAGTALFVVGNGTSSGDRNNALTILKNGRIGVNESSISDSRLRIRHDSSISDAHISLYEEENDFARLTFKNTLNSNYWTIAGRTRDGNTPAYLNFYYNEVGDILQLEGYSTYGLMRVNGQLRVSNNAIFSGFTQTADLYSTGAITAAGNICAANISCSSDLRLKKEISPLKFNWSEINLLNAFTSEWKDKSRGDGLQTGLIAQEVQQVFPEFVVKDSNGYLSVNYIGLIPHLLEAVKDLKSENDLLKANISSLNQNFSKKIAGLENLMKDLQLQLQKSTGSR